MVAKKTAKKVKALPTKALSPQKAKTIKGGGSSIYMNVGDIKGESDNRKDWIEMMKRS
jgi:hypothetical protein